MTLPPGPYSDLTFPQPAGGRPYVFCNMVATIDGKTVSGGLDETVMDLGSPADHAAMRQIEAEVRRFEQRQKSISTQASIESF